MAEFTSNLPGPGSVTGSIPIHESSAANIGSALSGFARILDVGLKAANQDREDKLLGTLEDKLRPVADQYGAQQKKLPTLIGEPTDPQDEAMNGHGFQANFGKIDGLRQANAQGRMSSSEFMSRASTIVQDMIHDHPRFADAIRQRAQKMLGTNPTEEMLKIQQEDEDYGRKAQREIEMKFVGDAQTAGIIHLNPDGTYNRSAMAATGAGIAQSKFDIEQVSEAIRNKNAILAGKHEEADITNINDEIYRRDHPKPTAEQIYKDTVVGVQKALGPTMDQITKAQFAGIKTNSLLNGDLENLSPNDKAQAQEAIFQGLGRAKAIVQRTFYELARKQRDSDGNPLDPKALDEAEAFFIKPYKDLEDLANSDLGAFKSQTRLLDMMTKNSQFQLATVAPLAFNLRAGLGDPAAATVMNSLIASEGPLSTQLQTQMGSWVTSITGVFGGKPLPNPATDPAFAKKIADSTIAVMKNYEQRAGNLTPQEQAAWANGASALATSGMQYDSGNIRQVQIVADNLSSPASLSLLDKMAHDPKTASQATALAGHVLEVHQHLIESMVPHLQPQTFKNQINVASGKLTDRIDVTYSPVYNPDTGRMEVYAEDSKGKPVKPDANNINITMINAVNSVNRSLTAMEHLKDYGGDTAKALSAAQVKQLEVQSAGIKMKPGTSPVAMPAAKAGEPPKTPAKAAPAQSATAESQAAISPDDPLGWFKEKQ